MLSKDERYSLIKQVVEDTICYYEPKTDADIFYICRALRTIFPSYVVVLNTDNAYGADELGCTKNYIQVRDKDFCSKDAVGYTTSLMVISDKAQFQHWNDIKEVHYDHFKEDFYVEWWCPRYDQNTRWYESDYKNCYWMQYLANAGGKR